VNRIFRIVWSRALHTWVVASELATRRGKEGRSVDRRVAGCSIAPDHVRVAHPDSPWPLRLGILTALMALYAPAHAADRYWDPNGTAVNWGGTATWNTTSPFWSPNGDGVSGPYSSWNNATLDNAIFGGTSGTVTLGAPITVHNITFASNGYTLTGGTLTLDGVTPTIDSGNGAVTQTISSVIHSTSGLTKAGTGTLVLNGSNTFNGGIDINGGALTLNAANSFTGTINAIGGSLTIGGTIGDAALGDIGNVINLGNGRSFSSTGAISGSRTVNLVSGLATIGGAGTGAAFYTGAGGLSVGDGISLTNDANDYQGQTRFTTPTGWSGSYNAFSSIADLGVASALGAPTTVANGTIVIGRGGGQDLGASRVYYTGTGDSSNRNWQMSPGSYAGSAALYNAGSGTLRLTGDIVAAGSSGHAIGFVAQSADMDLLGVISGNGHPVSFNSGSGHTIRLGTANTFSGQASVNGAGTVEASLIANAGVAGSLGTGSINVNGGNLSYVGAGETTDKTWTISNGSLNSNGAGALSLSGTVGIANTATLGGSFTGADNIISGVISGTGSLRSAGNSTWVLTGTNTYTGSTIVDSGVLRAGTADAFGGSTTAQVNGGTLDLNDFDRTFTTLAGTGGTVDLGSANLTLQAGTGTTATYAGSIVGSGGLTKLGASTQTLTGASTYTGATTIGGGTLNLDFRPAGGPTSNIIAGASTLNMGGGVLNVLGAAGESNTQTFNGLNITGSNNTISATSGSGGSLTVNLGAITRTGGLMNFNLPTSGNITTTNTTLGGWATVNGTDYAKVVSGNITAFTAADYTDKDNAANWLDNEYITDLAGFYGTVSGTKQLAGLRYTVAKSTTVTVSPGQTLGVDGTIIVAPSVLNTNQVITGGMLTGANGGDLGVQQNSTGNFTIASQIVDNGTPMGFVKAGTGLVTLTNANNSYTGATQVVQGTLSVNSIGNGGVASSIGASAADPSNLSLEGATLSYSGATTTSDRGFTFAKSGAILGSGVAVTDAAANLTFTGLVTSPDGATFTKSGAGTLTLANDTNDYTGVTTVTGGLLSVDTLANGGQVSGIGQSSSASANLVLDGGGLQYTGATVGTDRGFTLGANNGTVDVSNAATTLTVSGTVVQQTGGNRTLTKNGAGTLVLSGTNTYTGGNTINAGTLRAGSTQAFGGTGTVTLANVAGTTLDLDDFNNTIGALNGGGTNGGNVTLGSATLTIAGGNGNYSGVISGTGGVTRTSGGNQTFNGCNNTYTGRTYLWGSTITTDCLANGGQASGIGASGSASANLFFDSGALNYTGSTVAIDRGFQLNSGNSTISVTNAATTLTFGGAAIGGGGLVKGGAGTLVLSGANTYTGNTQVTGGVLRAGSVNAFGPSGHMTLNNTAGVLLDLDGFNTAVTSLIGGGTNGGNIDLGSATLTILDGANQTYSGIISGSGNLTKNGGGNQRLAGCNSNYTGTTTINAGILSVDCLADGGLNSSIGASTSDPANLVINGTLNYVGVGGSTDRQFTLGTSGGAIASAGSGIIQFTSTAPVILAGSNVARTLTLTGTNTGDNLFAGELDNNGAGVTSLTKTGTGSWRLANANSSYTGATTISGGVLSVDQMANGGQASSIGASSSAASNLVIGNGSTLRYTGAGDTTDRQFTLDTGVTYIESSGTGALQFTNIGAVSLTGTNTARTIALGGTNTDANTMGGTIGDNGTGATTLAKNDAGTWVLTGNNTYSGNTVINDGNLMIGDGGTTGNAGVGNVIVDSPTSTLSLNRSDTFTFSGTLSGPGTLAQIGSGTSVLTSANNQIGATTISDGTLMVDGALQTPTVDMTGTSALAVNGTVQAAGPTQTVLTGDAGSQTVTVGTGGTLLASGDLGDGSDVVDLTGTLDTGTGTLGLGNGDDTLVLHDGSQMLGGGVNASGGGGTDTLVVDTALGYTLDGGAVDTFDILTKQNTGPLTLTGDHDFDAGTHIDGGTLSVEGQLQTSALTMADDTTLNVDGSVEAAGGTPVAISGSTGSNDINVGIGGTLAANGDLGDGADTVTLAGELDTGASTLALGAGDDTLTLQSGAFITGAGVDAGSGGNDQLVLDSSSGLVFDGSQTIGFESLIKQNTDIARMIGSQSFAAGTSITGGTLEVAGSLTTPTVAMADGTTLSVDGSLQGAGGTGAVITGSAGDNTVTVGAGGSLLAYGDLGTGNDVLDVAGTLDTDGQILALGDGDDTLTIHEGTNIIGTVSAGAGNDTFDTHIDTVADLGAVQGFETLSKTGTGELNINGPLSSDFNTVNVVAGTLDVTAGGSVTGSPGIPLTTTVAAGATLNVDGSYGCSAGDDTMTVAGKVSGTGTIDLCGGDDTLTLQDGAVLNNTISGGTGTGDTLVLDNAGSLTFDASNTTNFELLQKNNTGTATLTGTQGFIGGTTIDGGTLDVDGTLETPTIALADGTVLNVDGTVQAAGPATTAITGSSGVNTVSVGVGGTLRASGDLGAGEDTLDVAGTLDTGGGTFDLGDGDDNFVVHDGTVVIGTIDGGAGLDTRTYDINTTADLGALVNFEGVTKTGTGVLNVTGPGATDLQEVQVLEGTMNVAAGASVVATAGSPLATTVAGGATLNVDGDYGCGAGNDTMSVSGSVSGSGTINLCGGDDTLTLNDGADLSGLVNPIDGDAGTGDKVVLNNAGALTLDAGQVANFEVLQKDNTGEATLTGAQSFSGGTVLNAGTLTVADTLDTPTVAMSDDTVLNVDTQLQAAGGAATVITGSAGTNTVNVAAGALLVANGDLGDGNDVLSVAGTLDSDGGVFSLGAGDDTFKVFDTTDTTNATIDGGAGNDTLDVNVGSGNTVPLGSLLGFESLGKSGDGTLEIHGPSNFIDVNVNAGMLRVTDTGSVSATDTAILAGATLELDGAGSYTGTSDADTFTVAGTVRYTGTGTIDLGAGDDTLDVSGTLDTGAGVFMLGDGDDNFVVHDGTVVLGTVDGGAGLDTRTYDINTTADLGALVNFEAVTKTGTGVLNINGPGTTDLEQVSVLGGTLNIGPAGGVVAIAGGPLDTVVASGATLNVDGSFGCGDSADTMTVAGTVSGSGTIDLCGGDDTLTLQDGAVLANTIDGGDHDAGDTVVLDNAGALTFDASRTTHFEYLQKENAGEATLVGNQSFVGGTMVNGGTLTVAGQLETPTADMADGTVLNVDGTLQAAGGTAIALSGSAGTNTVTVGEGGTLRATGDLGDGNDVLDVAGTLDTGTGSLLLGAGDDRLTVHDDTDIVGTVMAGAGNDTFDADIATHADLGAVQQFETLRKTGAGVLNVNGPASSDFTTVNVDAGTLNVAAGGSIAAQTTTVASGATLKIAGSYSGTSGDDSFVSRGTVIGALAFGAGNDSVDFIGGDMSGVTALDGGAGNDRLGFSGLTLDSQTLPALTGWERMELLNDSALTLDAPLDLGGGVLAIDGSSRLIAQADSAIVGNVENAGLIDVGANRLAIGGDYTSHDGTLQLTVLPGSLSTGGLDIAGDVRGTTAVTFGSDGSKLSGAGKVSILVISSPKDDPTTQGGFVAANTVDGAVRLDGSVFPWTFGQEADHNWYLNAQAGLLPEFPAYGVLPTLGALMAQQNDDIVHQRLAGIRGTERPMCGDRPEQQVDRAGSNLADDCHGLWVAVTGSSMDLGADPGIAASGSDVGMYVGVDYVGEDDSGTARIGAYLGYLHGNYWTTGTNSTGLPGVGAAGVRLDTPVGGWYGSLGWNNGAYVDVVVSGQRAQARVRTTDGFTQSLSGGSVTVSGKVGRRFLLDNGWSLDPHVRVTATDVHWDDMVDANDRQLTFANHWVDTVRAGLRAEKNYVTDSGATIKPWMTLAVQSTFGQTPEGLRIAEPGADANALALPNQDLGTAVRLDAGVEAKLNARVSLFGVLSASHELRGSAYRERAANLGVRVRW